MAIGISDKFKPKNNNTFALMDAEDIEMPDGSRLSELNIGGSGLPEVTAENNNDILQVVDGKWQKVKPLCYTEGGEVDLLPEMDYPFSLPEGETSIYAMSLPMNSTLPMFYVGKTYYVEWDDELFVVEAKALEVNGTVIEGIVVAGNLSILDSLLEETSVPFVLMQNIDGEAYLYSIGTKETDSSHKIRLYEKGETVHPLDPKYLPEDRITELIDSYMEDVFGGKY